MQDGGFADGQQWQLPDAPLPPDAAQSDRDGSGQRLGGAAAVGLSGRGTSRRNGRSAGPDQKQQVLADMEAARQALAAGNLDLAEKLAREASAAGVPESQFLPDEDRPTQLAWDIVRARQGLRGAQPAVATMPPGAGRYAQQAGQMPTGRASGVIQAAGTEAGPPFDSDERWAMVPDPIVVAARVGAVTFRRRRRRLPPLADAGPARKTVRRRRKTKRPTCWTRAKPRCGCTIASRRSSC